MNLSKQPVVAYASRPWQGSSRGSSSPGDFYGSDTPEAIALCMNCTREDCTSSCWEIKESLETGERLGSIWIWDKLEDLFNVHQRVLREIHRGTADNQ